MQHSSSSFPHHALALGLAVLLVLAAACSSDSSDEAETAPEAEATPTEESATSEESDSPGESATDEPSEDSDEFEVPTIDAEAALEGIDTDTPPRDGYCEASAYFASADFQVDFREFLEEGPGADDAAENIDAQMTNLVELAPPDLEDDARAVADVVTEYVEAVTEAVETDDFVDATALQESFAEVAESGERLAAYDEVVCGNPAPGTEGT